MRTLNLGILAHVDAGKTSLTERLLHAAGVIDAIGSVDAGTTQTDTLALERQRGITIRAAVASFTVDGVRVNLIDTPGHPDFIAEVDRSLTVLDGAVLVVSAVEGVQPQTLVLMRALRRLRVATMVFVNKIDRVGADHDRVVSMVQARLGCTPLPLNTVSGVGTPAARVLAHRLEDAGDAELVTVALAEHDDDALAAYVEQVLALAPADLVARVADQTRRGELTPVCFGSAMTGAGVVDLLGWLPRLLPTTEADPDAPVSGSVFKIDRGAGGEQVAFVRVRAGTIRRRDRLPFGPDSDGVVTSIAVFDDGGVPDRAQVEAGQIARLTGLRGVRVGDSVGIAPLPRFGDLFARPTLETAVVARDPAQQGALHAALVRLAEQDPLINLRQDDVRHELFVSLFGEVQKEVIEYTLAAEHQIEVDFRESTVICAERVIGRGHAVEWIGDPANPFTATIGLTVEPAPIGSGLELRIAVEPITIPYYVYKNPDEFRRSMARYLETTLRQGLFGWPVLDCVVTLTECDYNPPATTAGDLRKLTPLVIMAALRDAGTRVCEPVHRIRLDAPTDTLSAVLGLLGRHRGVPAAPEVVGEWFSVAGDVPSVEITELQRRLPGRSHGEGVLEATFDRYAPVTGEPPVRPRTDDNPLDRKEYLRHVVRRM